MARPRRIRNFRNRTKNVAAQSPRLAVLFQRASPALEEALLQRTSPAHVMSILASIGDGMPETLFEQYVDDRETEVAQAAREALRLLHSQRPT